LPRFDPQRLHAQEPTLELASGTGAEALSGLVLSWTVDEYLRRAELDWEEFAEFIGPLGVQEHRLTGYQVYEVTLELSVTLPDDETFAPYGSDRDLSRTSEILILAEDALLEWGGTSAVIALGNGAFSSHVWIKLRQRETETGVTLLPVERWSVVADE
jgi:hypothetical protein